VAGERFNPSIGVQGWPGGKKRNQNIQIVSARAQNGANSLPARSWNRTGETNTLASPYNLRRIVARGRRQKTEKHRKVLDFGILLLQVEVQPLDLKNRPVRKNMRVSASTPRRTKDIMIGEAGD